MAEKKLFNADVLLSSFAECNSNIGDIPMKSFMTGVEELKRIVCESVVSRAGRSKEAKGGIH